MEKTKIFGRSSWVLSAGVALVIALPTAFAADSEIVSSDALVEQLKVSDSNLGKSRSLGFQTFQSAGSGGGAGTASISSIQFDYNSASLTASGREQVDELAKAINQLESESFQIIGHTDASGDDSYNLNLSKRRAASVVSYLVNTHGVSKTRLESIGKGETELADDNAPTAAENRRVEIVNARVAN